MDNKSLTGDTFVRYFGPGYYSFAYLCIVTSKPYWK